MFGRKINIVTVIFSTVSIPLAKPHQPVDGIKWYHTSTAILSHSFAAKDKLGPKLWKGQLLSKSSTLIHLLSTSALRAVYSSVSGPAFYLNSDPDPTPWIQIYADPGGSGTG